jgi:hypothetical protein
VPARQQKRSAQHAGRSVQEAIMITTMAKVFGVAFLVAGILGFIPAAAPHGMLLGIFHVDPLHNLVHIATGVWALAAGFGSLNASLRFFRVFGFIYLAVALIGFVSGDRPVLGVMANNVADAWFHLVVAGVSLALGYSRRGRMTALPMSR